jgi:hypothetical protein
MLERPITFKVRLLSGRERSRQPQLSLLRRTFQHHPPRQRRPPTGESRLEDIAYRVIAANQRPDHTTVARFRQRHQDALAGLFGEVLGLCAQAGLLRSG